MGPKSYVPSHLRLLRAWKLGLAVTCIFTLVTFAISNSNQILLFVRLDDSIMGYLIVLNGKKGVTH